jgi:hypothetical protein
LILCQEGIEETPLENQEDTETTDESSESPWNAIWIEI